MAKDIRTVVPRRWLIVANTVTIVLLLGILWREHYFSRISNRLLGKTDTVATVPYDRNYWYIEQTDLQRSYHSRAAIVLLGTSFTYRAQWAELLHRQDVLNRGIPSDVTEGLLHRIDLVIAASPRVCLVEAGANDIDQRKPYDSIAANLRQVCLQLRSAGISPVLNTIPYTSVKCAGAWPLNYRIYYANNLLRTMCRANHIPLLDLNALLAAGMMTRPEYTTPDGIHLSARAYALWAAAIRPYLPAAE